MDIQEPDTLEAYLTRVKPRFEAEEFSILEDALYDTHVFRMAAGRSGWRMETFRPATFVFTFTEFMSIDMDKLRMFSELTLQYARRFKKPFLWFLSGKLYSFSVAVCHGVDDETVRAVRGRRARWNYIGEDLRSEIKMPVVYDLNTRHLHYAEKVPWWLVYDHDKFKRMIPKLLASQPDDGDDREEEFKQGYAAF